MFLNIGEEIKRLRLEAGYDSLGELNRASKVPVSTLSRIEANVQKPTPQTLKKLAQHLRVSYEHLMAVAGYLSESEKYKVELLDLLEDSDKKLLVAGQPLSKEHRLNVIKLLDNPSAFGTSTIPLLGQIKMGVPLLAQDNWDGELEIPSDIRADFALEARGDSMIGVGLIDGDYAICRETNTANSGQIVAALHQVDSETNEATLKFYFNEKDGPALRAANPNYKDIPINEEWRIGGVLVGVIRKDSPVYKLYNNYLAPRDLTMERWKPVLERAFQLGIKPEQVESLLEAIYQTAKR